MNEVLKKFLDDKKSAERKAYDEEKRKVLLEFGLFEKVYSPEDSYSEEYYLSEWDAENKKQKYYKRSLISITDEEYEEIKKYSYETKEANKTDSFVASALSVIAWIIFIGGFIAGFAFGTVAVACACWCASFVSGMMFFGFAEIIKLLVAIKNK